MGEDFSVESQGKLLQEIAAEVQLGEVREGGEGGDVGNLGKGGGLSCSQPLIFPCCTSHQADMQTDRDTPAMNTDCSVLGLNQAVKAGLFV